MLKLIVTIGAIQVVAIVVNLLRSKTMAVLLGPQGVGIVSVVDQFTQLVVQITAVGLPFAAVKFLSRSHSRDAGAFRTTYASLLRVLLVMTGGGAVISLAILYWHPEWLGRDLLAYRRFLLPALLGGPLFALHGFFLSVLAAAQQPRSSALLTLVIAVVLTAAVIAGISVGGITGLYWGIWLASLLIAGGVVVYLKRRLGLPIVDRTAGLWNEWRANRDAVTFSLVLYGTSFTYALAYFVARYAVLHNIGERGAGLLQAAIALSGTLYLVLGPTNGLYLTPILNRNIPAHDKIQAATSFQGRLMVLVGVMAMLIVLFPRVIVSLFFSAAFVEVGRALFVFVIAQCIGQLNGVTQALLVGVDDLKAYGAVVAAGHLSAAAFSWLLVPAYGVLGVGIALLISSVVVWILTMARISLTHRVSMPPAMRSLIGYEIVALAVVGGFVGNAPFEPLVVLSKVGLYVAFVGGLVLFTDGADRQVLVRGLRRLRARAA